MSAIPQVRVREREFIPAADPDVRIPAATPGRDNPLQLLRDALAGLNSSNGELADQAQVADLLAEAREALERANVINRAVAQCEEFLREARSDKALQALDAGLLAYPEAPALVTRRCEVERQQSALLSAATVRTALEEAQWLLDRDRPDLAARLLKEKAADLPDQPALIFRLQEFEALLPQWEQNRHVQAALGRVAALERLQQWHAGPAGGTRTQAQAGAPPGTHPAEDRWPILETGAHIARKHTARIPVGARAESVAARSGCW